MRIVHIVESFAGGVYAFLYDLIESMPDFEHIIIHGMRSDTPQGYMQNFGQNVTFHRWVSAKRGINFWSDLESLVELIKIIKKIPDYKSINIVHLHSSKAGFLGRCACRLLGMQDKTIYTPHGVSFLRRDISRIKKKCYLIFEKFAFRLGGMIMACSKSESDEITKNGIKSDFINNGVMVAAILPKPCQQPRDYLIIGTAGRITSSKNPLLFNRIAERFVNMKQIKFLWIGDGELKGDLKSSNIQVTGWQKQNEVLDMMMQIDIYLSTSLSEGMPLSALQAMSLAKPLILSNCVGNIDLIFTNSNGLLFDSYEESIDALLILINNKELREQMGNMSRYLAIDHFSINNTMKQYRQKYIDIA